MIERLKSIFDETLKWGVCFRDHFLKILQFWLTWWCHSPKLGQKGPKLVFHVPIVIKTWNVWSEVFYFETTISKFWSFDSIQWHHQPKNGSKRSKLVFHVPMLIERWKSKLRVTLRWSIHLWNCSLKKLFDLMWWCHQPKIGLKKSPNSYHILYCLVDPILAIMMSELRLKFQNLWNLYLEVNIFASKFL